MERAPEEELDSEPSEDSVAVLVEIKRGDIVPYRSPAANPPYRF